jgi:hypothetical protein
MRKISISLLAWISTVDLLQSEAKSGRNLGRGNQTVKPKETHTQPILILSTYTVHSQYTGTSTIKMWEKLLIHWWLADMRNRGCIVYETLKKIVDYFIKISTL